MRPSSGTAPGKIILSGEHAVVYGAPALVMAVNRYMTATISSLKGDDFVFHDVNANTFYSIGADQLDALKARIQNDYHSFLKGRCSICDVLKTPVELAQFTLSTFLEAVSLDFLSGIQLDVQSTIPVGAGMGSSAALILSILKAMMQYTNVSLSDEKLFELALGAENRQHGLSSGLDLRAILQGGLMLVGLGRVGKALFACPPPRIEMVGTQTALCPPYIVYTGVPESATGECVQLVSPYFKDQNRVEAFSAVTIAMEKALEENNLVSLHECIRENNQLLHQIGVVPETVQRFISDIESIGGAAKICGAGAVKGDHAGMVWVVCEDTAAWKKIAEKYSYEVLSLNIESRGVYAS